MQKLINHSLTPILHQKKTLKLGLPHTMTKTTHKKRKKSLPCQSAITHPHKFSFLWIPITENEKKMPQPLCEQERARKKKERRECEIKHIQYIPIINNISRAICAKTVCCERGLAKSILMSFNN
jgi:hypothetical protein